MMMKQLVSMNGGLTCVRIVVSSHLSRFVNVVRSRSKRYDDNGCATQFWIQRHCFDLGRFIGESTLLGIRIRGESRNRVPGRRSLQLQWKLQLGAPPQRLSGLGRHWLCGENNCNFFGVRRKGRKMHDGSEDPTNWRLLWRKSGYSECQEPEILRPRHLSDRSSLIGWILPPVVYGSRTLQVLHLPHGTICRCSKGTACHLTNTHQATPNYASRPGRSDGIMTSKCSCPKEVVVMGHQYFDPSWTVI